MTVVDTLPVPEVGASSVANVGSEAESVIASPSGSDAETAVEPEEFSATVRSAIAALGEPGRRKY